MKRSSKRDRRLSAESAVISEIFHELSQPLTAMQCTLELSLCRDHTAEEYRCSLQAGLQNAERLRQRLVMIRSLNEIEDASDTDKATDFNLLLSELEEDWSVLFRDAGKRFNVTFDDSALVLKGDHAKLLRALFYFVEYLFRYSCEGSLTELSLAKGTQSATLHIHSEACLPMAALGSKANKPYSCEIELARRTLRAAGGSFELLSFDGKHSDWQAELPLA